MADEIETDGAADGVEDGAEAASLQASSPQDLEALQEAELGEQAEELLGELIAAYEAEGDPTAVVRAEHGMVTLDGGLELQARAILERAAQLAVERGWAPLVFGQTMALTRTPARMLGWIREQDGKMLEMRSR